MVVTAFDDLFLQIQLYSVAQKRSSVHYAHLTSGWSYIVTSTQQTQQLASDSTTNTIL